jgi:RNA polymerase sigma factor (sigma-70 family)
MRASYKGLAFRELDRLFRCGTTTLGDGALVGRFVRERNESAFETLVARHGPMVLGVCRRLLKSAHDADDAFQATFLVLAQNAARLRDPDRLGPWLYGVATRVATKARARASRHRHEPLVEAFARDEPSAEWSDFLPILDAELGRLPAKHRDVLVLCLLQGATPEEASQCLGCPVGTVKSRLARGREALRGRLTGRGIAPALVGLLASETISSPVPPALARATLELIGGSPVAPGIITMVKGTVPTMFTKSIVAASVIVGGLTLAGAGTAAWLRTSAAQGPGQLAQSERTRKPSMATNLKEVLLAFHNFYSVNARLPTSAIYGADGEPKLSWRVALLPYLDQNELYNQFRQDEPWDSPHNKALIDHMPVVFETPGAPAPAGQTRIRGFVGKGALFEGTQGIAFQEVTDGLSNTLMIAVAAEPAPWTKPGELVFVPGLPLPALDNSDPHGYWIGLMDGSCRALQANEARLLPSLITRGGGEVIVWPGAHVGGATTAAPGAVFAATAPVTATPAPLAGPTAGAGGTIAAPTDRMAPAPGPQPGGLTLTVAKSQEALEHRIAVVEKKLDLIIQKLDAVLLGDAERRRSRTDFPR